MRYFVILLLLFVHLVAEQNKQDITIGAGVYSQSQPYKNVSPLILATPIIFFDNSLIYARWSRFGLYFLGDKKEEYSWGASLTIQPRTLGYKASNSEHLKGMRERESTLEAGLAIGARYKNATYIEFMLLADILNKYNSWISSVEVGKKFKAGSFTFYPSAVLLYQSKKFVDYYYGVKSTEAMLNRPAYTPNGGFCFAVQTYINYPLTKKLSAFFNIRAETLPNSAYKSPLVNNKFIYSGLASLIYTFNY